MIITQDLKLYIDQKRAFLHLLKLDTREFWYVGGFGSGKSLTGAKLVEEVAMRYKGIRIGMIRDTLVNFKNTSLKTFLEVVDPRLFKHNKSTNTIKFVNGSEALYFGLDDTQAIARLQSLELGFLWVDEVDGVTERIYNIATKRLRQTSPDEKAKYKALTQHKRYKADKNMVRYPRKALVTSNSAGQNWTWNRFVNKPHNLTAWTRAISHTNKSLPKEYLESLDELKHTSPDDYKRFVMADFNVFEGQIYKEWNEAVHVVDPFPIPHDWEKIATIDFALRNYCAIIYIAIDPAGNAYQYDEYYEKDTTPRNHCDDLIAHDFDEVLGDPSMFNKTQVKGQHKYAVVDEYDEYGVQVYPAQNDHEAGRSYVKKALRENKFFVMRNCVHTIRTIPQLRWKPIRMIQGVEIIDEEEAQGQEDHIPDCVRYFWMERYNPRLVRKTEDELWEINRRLLNPLLPAKVREKLETEVESDWNEEQFQEQNEDSEW